MLDALDPAEWAALAAIGTLIAAVAALISAWFAYRSRRDAGRSTEALEGIAGQLRNNAAVPPVDWRIEHRGRDSYALRNIGADTATGVRVNTEELPRMHHGLPEGDVNIPRGQAHRFLLKGSAQRPVPPELLVSCDQLPERAVPMPPKT